MSQSKRGPEKRKEQITVRIDMDLMAEVEAQMAEDGARITDLVEEGLILALEKRRHQMPAWTKQFRFISANITAQQTEVFRGLAIRMAEIVVNKNLSPEAKMLFEVCQKFLKAANSLPHAQACLELYSQFGKRLAR